MHIFISHSSRDAEFADSVCDEFFSLPLFPQALCDEDALRARNVSCTCGTHNSITGLGCNAGTCGCGCNNR